jgi:hypothetical protein
LVAKLVHVAGNDIAKNAVAPLSRFAMYPAFISCLFNRMANGEVPHELENDIWIKGRELLHHRGPFVTLPLLTTDALAPPVLFLVEDCCEEKIRPSLLKDSRYELPV